MKCGACGARAYVAEKTCVYCGLFRQSTEWDTRLAAFRFTCRKGEPAVFSFKLVPFPEFLEHIARQRAVNR